MGGFWLPNLKLLDGMWLGINDDWIGPATKTTSGWGYVRADLPTTDGVSASRTDFVPRGVSGAVVGLSLRAAAPGPSRYAQTHTRSCCRRIRGERPTQPTRSISPTRCRSGASTCCSGQGHAAGVEL